METTVAVPISHPQIAIQDTEPLKSPNLDEELDDEDIIDEAMERFLAMCEKAEKRDPWCIPETVKFFPGRTDSFRLISEESRQLKMAEYSGKALAYFNKTYNTDYKFENGGEIIHSDEDHSFASHCNFTAKPETAPLVPGDFSSKLFFAELMPNVRLKSSLTCCALLDGADHQNKCSMCPMGLISHPKTFRGGYKLPLD